MSMSAEAIPLSSQTLRQRIMSRLSMLEADRESWMDHWRSISQYTQPRSGQFLSTKRQPTRGGKLNEKIVDGTATYAARTLGSGMLAGLTSPSRPWFRLSTPDPDLAEFRSVKAWLEIVQRRMELLFQKSNLYKVLPLVYQELGMFGTCPMMIEDDFRKIFRFRYFTIGSYMLANNAKLETDTLYREFQMTARQMVAFFGEQNVSETVRSEAMSDQGEAWHDVVHAIEPNDDPGRDFRSPFARQKPWRSIWLEKGESEVEFLRHSGFDAFPIMAPKWGQVAEDQYGSYCPGFDSYGDVRALTLKTRRKDEALDKQVKPPMAAPMSLKNQRASTIAGDTTFVNTLQGQQKFERLFDVDIPLGDLTNDIREIQDRVNEAYYKQLFLTLITDRRAQPATAREIEELHEEKLLMLGPVLEGLQEDLLDPLIDRAFEKMVNDPRGIVPPAPPDLQGVELKVEYISALALAQQSVANRAIESTAAFTLSLSERWPDIVDKFDADKALEEYHRGRGGPVQIIRDDDATEQIREQRALQQQAMQAAAASREQAEQAEIASRASFEDGTSVLDALAGAA